MTTTLSRRPAEISSVLSQLGLSIRTCRVGGLYFVVDDARLFEIISGLIGSSLPRKKSG